MASAAGKRTRSKVSYVAVEEGREITQGRKKMKKGKTQEKPSKQEKREGSVLPTQTIPTAETPFAAELSKSSASDLLSQMKDGQLIEARSDQSLYEIFGVLKSNKILSAPIYDINSKKYIGFIDNVDIVSAVVDIVQPIWESLQMEGRKEEDVENIAEYQEKFAVNAITAKNIADISKRDPFICIKEDDSVKEPARLLKTCHRIGVMDNEGKLKGIVSQMGLVEYLMEEHPSLWNATVKNLTVKDLQLPSEVRTIPQDKSALEAFKMMKETGVSGLGVVDEEGRLKDVISVSDLTIWSEWIAMGTAIRFSNLTALNNPIHEFLVNSRAQNDVEQKVKPVECRLEKNVGECVDEMLFHNVHRMFVVDEKQHPISVFTFGDIISRVVFFC